jgi:hypothetical protein
MHGKNMNAHMILFGKSDGKEPLGRRRRRAEGWSGVDWIDLAEDKDQ